MQKEIDGKVYKEIQITKIVVNGSNQESNVISADNANEGVISVTIVADQEEK